MTIRYTKYKYTSTFLALILVTLATLVISSCVPLTQQGAGGATSVPGAVGKTNKSGDAINEDAIFESQVRTVQLYPNVASNAAVLNYPIISLPEAEALMLEFDDLTPNYTNYYAKIIACNNDWTTSILNDLEYLTQFNEFIIDGYEVSNSTRQTYYHYTFNVPKPKLSGNYILKVYRNHNPDEAIFTRRFMVYESIVAITPDIKFPLDINNRFKGQQIDFTISYGDYDLFNPSQNVKVVLRQNGRWDNAITSLRPMFIRDEDKLLDYHYFGNEAVFMGGNEWRTVDIRSMRFLGQNMAKTTFNNDGAEITLLTDVTRNRPNYNQWIDINGQFVIQNFETKDANTKADYVNVNFILESPKKANGKVYVFGKLSDFALNQKFEMRFDSTTSQYRARINLKQGFYNYQYVVASPNGKVDEIMYEGSYNITENNYDWLVYFRPIGCRYDKLIGYKMVDYYGKTGN